MRKSLIKSLLHDFVSKRQVITTIDIEEFKKYVQNTYGNIPGILTLRRYVRLMADPSSNWYCLKRLSNDEKLMYNVPKKIAAYQYIGSNIDKK